MSEEKPYEPTPSRRERAKREGNAARSHEVAGIASFAGALIALVAALPVLSGTAAEIARSTMLTHAASPERLIALGALALGPAIGAALAGVGLSLAQTGGVRVTALTFAPAKLAPLPGLKRMFGTEAIVGAGRAGIAFLAVVAVVVPIGAGVFAAASVAGSPLALAGVARDGMLRAAFTAAATGALFAAADYALARRRWLHGLKMTFEEMKRDAREQDGDPHAKSRRRLFHRTLSRGAIARTREASFVVVNPTHIAIALRYAPPLVPVPEILVRAADALAGEVRAIAQRARVPIVENVALARLLWRTGDAGRPIPAETFVAVAHVIAALARAGVLEG